MRIELRACTRHFGRLRALDGLTLVIPSGRRVALIGPNGSGKSTLTRVLMGMLQCAGEVRLDGLSPHLDRDRLAGRLAYVPQSAPQFGATVREIVAAVSAVRGLDPGRVAAAADALSLDLEEVGAKAVRSLSGGMKQKLLLALAFAARADLLILDEPTASLDAASRAAFYRLMETEAGQATVILCSHRLEEVRHLVDHVVALEEGRVAWEGPLADYLQGAAHSVVELRARPEIPDAWFQRRGFHRGGSGDWARVVVHAEAIPLLREVLTAWNGEIAGVRVRDLETIEASVKGTAPVATSDPERKEDRHVEA